MNYYILNDDCDDCIQKFYRKLVFKLKFLNSYCCFMKNCMFLETGTLQILFCNQVWCFLLKTILSQWRIFFSQKKTILDQYHDFVDVAVVIVFVVIVVVDHWNLPLNLFVAVVAVVVVFVVVDNNDDVVVFDVVLSLKPSIKVWSVIDEMLLLLLLSMLLLLSLLILQTFL